MATWSAEYRAGYMRTWLAAHPGYSAARAKALRLENPTLVRERARVQRVRTRDRRAALEWNTHHSGIDTHELAWAAGFFDGEGTTHYNRNSGQIFVQISQVDRRALDRFKRSVLDLGNVRGPYTNPGRGPRKPYFKWGTEAFQGSQATIALLFKYLGPVKRAQALNVLQTYASDPRRRHQQHARA